jgi:hypothetical protein
MEKMVPLLLEKQRDGCSQGKRSMERNPPDIEKNITSLRSQIGPMQTWKIFFDLSTA